MLPVCEDTGLTNRANKISTIEKIVALWIYMATLAIKLDKPLSGRLFPITNKKDGEMTTFNSPYLVNCKIFTVD